MNSRSGSPQLVRKPWTSSLRTLLSCIMVLGILPFWPAPARVHARGIAGSLSRVVPLAGVVIGWRQRNRVYRTSEDFIRDRNQYYDGLRETARGQLIKRQVLGLRPSQTKAYVQVVALIEQERAGQLAVAEARKSQARQEFHNRVEEAVIYSVAGGNLARQVISSLQGGVGSAQQVLERALGKVTGGGSDALQDLQRIRQIASQVSKVAGIIGGEAGRKISDASDRIVKNIDQPQETASRIIEQVQGDLKVVDGTLKLLEQVGRTPSAGQAIEHVVARTLPGSGAQSSIAIEATASILSQREVGDGSLKDEARKALLAGFAGRCAEFSTTLQAQLDALRGSQRSDSAAVPGVLPCRELKRGELLQRVQLAPVPDLDQFLATEEPEVLPRVTATGSFSEALSGMVNTSRPMGTTFRLAANLQAGSITGSLTGGRTTSGNPMNCVNAENPAIILDVAYVDYTDAYKADFSGSIHGESGTFSAALSPKGSTIDRKTSPFTAEGCLALNGAPAPGSTGWVGQGTISGYVTKDGAVQFSTSWTSFGGKVHVGGSWSGSGTVSGP